MVPRETKAVLINVILTSSKGNAVTNPIVFLLPPTKRLVPTDTKAELPVLDSCNTPFKYVVNTTAFSTLISNKKVFSISKPAKEPAG